jgi:hypothetical protein
MFLVMKESFGTIAHVVVCFLYTSKEKLSFSFDMVISRDLIFFFFFFNSEFHGGHYVVEYIKYIVYFVVSLLYTMRISSYCYPNNKTTIRINLANAEYTN